MPRGIPKVPRPRGPKHVIFTVYLEDSLLERVDDLAKELEISRSRAVTQLLTEALDSFHTADIQDRTFTRPPGL
jgi:metal-responsive CopG/Arc/MetJ family transcriptional regulator